MKPEDSFETKVAKVSQTEKAKALREAVQRAVVEYQLYLETEIGSRVSVTLGPKQESDSRTLVQWDEIKRRVH